MAIFGDDCKDGIYFTAGGALALLVQTMMGGPLIKILPKEVYTLINVAMLGYGGYKLMTTPGCIDSVTNR